VTNAVQSSIQEGTGKSEVNTQNIVQWNVGGHDTGRQDDWVFNWDRLSNNVSNYGRHVVWNILISD